MLRYLIPWEKITGRLSQFYDKTKGVPGKNLRMMTALVFYKLSDRDVVKSVKDNRYIQYFCDVADQGLTDPSLPDNRDTLGTFRMQQQVFNLLNFLCPAKKHI
ncbi:MAG: transposase [Desulfobacteraceae bacterium]|nr:transposase [Desulfobacteraceae bacterium]